MFMLTQQSAPACCDCRLVYALRCLVMSVTQSSAHASVQALNDKRVTPCTFNPPASQTHNADADASQRQPQPPARNKLPCATVRDHDAGRSLLGEENTERSRVSRHTTLAADHVSSLYESHQEHGLLMRMPLARKCKAHACLHCAVTF
jgi:hypothetical protein